MQAVRGLVITAFDAAGQRVADTVRRGLRELGIEAMSVDPKHSAGAPIADAVTDAIRHADFIVVDLSRGNPNVLYELGYAHALRKPSILLMGSDSSARLPSDLAGYFYIPYDTANLRGLKEEVQRAARKYTSLVES